MTLRDVLDTNQSILEAQPVDLGGVWRVQVRFAHGETRTFERPIEHEIGAYLAAGDRRSSEMLAAAAALAARLNGLR